MNNQQNEVAIQVRGLKKEYRTGQFGYGTLTADLQSWWAKRRGKEDPNSIIGETENLRNKGRFLALDDINFDVYKGDTIGIIGGNGAGKSTLLKLLSRITAPSAGCISYNGRISSMLEVGTGFNPEMTGRENIYMNGTILGMTKEEVNSKMDDIISFSECERFIDTPVKRYSSGMYVKLAFSVAANLDSEILIMDEVLAVGDMKFQRKCINKMRELAHEDGRTVLYVSHNMETIRELCNRCIVLSKGKLVYDGDVENAIQAYNEEEITAEVFMNFEHAAHHVQTARGYLHTLEFVGKHDTFFSYGELLRMKVVWTPTDAECEYFFRIIVLDENQRQIGMSNKSLGKGFVPNKQYVTVLEMENIMLSEGKYLLNFELNNRIFTGTCFSCDWPILMTEIEIGHCPNEESNWDKTNWGNIRFPTMKKVQEKE